MRSEYRVIFQTSSDSAVERNKIYNAIKARIGQLQAAGLITRADILKDEIVVDLESSSERLV